MIRYPSEPCNVDHCARDSKTIACNDGNECKCFCHIPQAFEEARAQYYKWKRAHLKSMLDRVLRAHPDFVHLDVDGFKTSIRVLVHETYRNKQDAVGGFAVSEVGTNKVVYLYDNENPNGRRVY